MKNLAQRLLVFFIGVPFIIALSFVDFQYHLPLQIIIAAFSVLGANELYEMLAKKHKLFNKAFILIFTGLQPLLAYIFILAGLPHEYCQWLYIFEVIIFMIFGIFQNDFDGTLEKIGLSSFIVLYTGYFFTYLQRLTSLENSTFIVALFYLLVFMCDSLAWFFGMLFGKKNKGFVKASPNKSIAGFLGGIAGCIGSGCLFKFIIEKFNVMSVLPGEYWKVVILGFFVAIAAITGDLVESVMKRDTDVKDSGKLIPGRGGVLDSIDSLIVAVPVYSILMHFLF